MRNWRPEPASCPKACGAAVQGRSWAGGPAAGAAGLHPSRPIPGAALPGRSAVAAAARRGPPRRSPGCGRARAVGHAPAWRAARAGGLRGQPAAARQPGHLPAAQPPPERARLTEPREQLRLRPGWEAAGCLARAAFEGRRLQHVSQRSLRQLRTASA